MNKYEERLYNEWSQHSKLLIAVDYDHTIFPYRGLNNQEDIDRTINLLQIAHNTGAYITINTCSNSDRYKEIQDHCDKLNIPIDGINVNPIQLPYGKFGKIYANIYLDDRAGLTQALDMLEKVMYKIRGDNASNLTLGEEV